MVEPFRISMAAAEFPKKIHRTTHLLNSRKIFLPVGQTTCAVLWRGRHVFGTSAVPGQPWITYPCCHDPTVACRWESGTLVLPYSVHNLPMLENFHVYSDGNIAVCTILIHFLRPSIGGVVHAGTALFLEEVGYDLCSNTSTIYLDDGPALLHVFSQTHFLDPVSRI